MSFKIGDVCLLILGAGNVYNGQEVIVTAGLANRSIYKLGGGLTYLADVYLVVDSDGLETAQKPHELRLKRPSSKDEPLLDHLPCQPEFTEDLSRWMRKTVKL